MLYRHVHHNLLANLTTKAWNRVKPKRNFVGKIISNCFHWFGFEKLGSRAKRKFHKNCFCKVKLEIYQILKYCNIFTFQYHNCHFCYFLLLGSKFGFFFGIWNLFIALFKHWNIAGKHWLSNCYLSWI